MIDNVLQDIINKVLLKRETREIRLPNAESVAKDISSELAHKVEAINAGLLPAVSGVDYAHPSSLTGTAMTVGAISPPVVNVSHAEDAAKYAIQALQRMQTPPPLVFVPQMPKRYVLLKPAVRVISNLWRIVRPDDGNGFMIVVSATARQTLSMPNIFSIGNEPYELLDEVQVREIWPQAHLPWPLISEMERVAVAKLSLHELEPAVANPQAGSW